MELCDLRPEAGDTVPLFRQEKFGKKINCIRSFPGILAEGMWHQSLQTGRWKSTRQSKE